MQTVNTAKTIQEIINELENGSIVRGARQRTPSHNATYAGALIKAIMENNAYIGVITLGRAWDMDYYEILDGSSRIKDFENFINNELSYEKITDTDGKKQPKYFRNYTTDEKNKFLNTEVNVMILENISSDDELQNIFISLNNGVNLSAIQKNIGVVSDDFLQGVNTLKQADFINKSLTKTALQKDELKTIMVQVIANINDCYSANNAKMVSDIKDKDFDFSKFANVVTMLDAIDIKMTKYCIISLLTELYKAYDIFADSMLELDNTVVFEPETSGANSLPKNEERLLKAKYLLYKLYCNKIGTKNQYPLTKTKQIPASFKAFNWDNMEVATVQTTDSDTDTDILADIMQ